MAEKTDNYQRSRDRAQGVFLGYDQRALIETWHLEHDPAALYVPFLGQRYRVDRKTGRVTRADGQEAGYEETLSIFDLLCHQSPVKTVSGRFAPVNSLRGRPAIGVTTDFHTGAAARFDRERDAFCRACLCLGAAPVKLGDLGFSFPVFGELEVRLKFYESDEEFPASLTLLWDENMLQYVFYETVFYIAGYLLERIQAQMSTKEEPI